MNDFPNLAKLSLSTGVYPENKEKAWTDRDDLIKGGCNRKSEEGARCFERWREALFNEALRRSQEQQRTIVLLSVGAGVLEALALRDIWEFFPLERVWLIDPGLDRATADQVTKEMRTLLPKVDIVYFAEKTAYADAMARLDKMGNNEVIAVGALNKSFGRILQNHAKSLQERLEPLLFVETLNTLAGKNNKDGEHPMRFIEAYVDDNDEVHFRKPWAEYWLATEKLELANSMLQMNASILRELNETTPDARGK